MLVDGGTVVNLMTYSMFKMLRREDDKLVKTNLILNSMGGATRWRLEMSSPWSPPKGASRSLPHSFLSRCKVIIVLFWVAIGFTPIIVLLLLTPVLDSVD
jgi:hypothetical protein